MESGLSVMRCVEWKSGTKGGNAGDLGETTENEVSKSGG